MTPCTRHLRSQDDRRNVHPDPAAGESLASLHVSAEADAHPQISTIETVSTQVSAVKVAVHDSMSVVPEGHPESGALLLNLSSKTSYMPLVTVSEDTAAPDTCRPDTFHHSRLRRTNVLSDDPLTKTQELPLWTVTSLISTSP